MQTNICKFCNKNAKSNIVQCELCDLWVHKFCCEKNKIIILNDKVKCCEENFVDAVDSDEPITNTMEGRLRREIVLLNLLLKEREQVIKDKCTIIKDKEIIISILQDQLRAYSVSKDKGLLNQEAEKPKDNEPNLATSQSKNQMKGASLPNQPTQSQNEGSESNPSVKNINKANKQQQNSGTIQTDLVQTNRDRKIQSKKRIATRKQNAGIIGTSSVSDKCIGAAPKMVSLFVSRLKPETRSEDLKEFVRRHFPEAECSVLISKYPEHYSSFKVCINSTSEEAAMDPSKWPLGSYVSKFFQKKKLAAVNG